MENLWPEVLEFKINPPRSRSAALIKSLKQTHLRGVFRLLKFLKQSGSSFVQNRNVTLR